ncbi:putative peptidyl-prolyl cis-trans isomerase chloroplast precursor [Scenedesmus sp. NREL 46B-D3]|nr:putative peptidyl-prolyl cis-trans isomerase chloroplast precursor [Scenedesmus sp. NREL 46B-D3]
MLAKAAELGLDTAALKPVTQEGCLFGAAAPASSNDASDDASSSVGIAAVPANGKKQQGSKKAATPAGGSKGSAKVASTAAALDPLAVTQKVEFTITIGGKPAGKVTMGMFGNAAPKTVRNFVAICKGAKGSPSYVGTKFHRVIKDFMVQGGDFENGDGTGGYSIYGASFADENLTFELSRGVLAMANSGPDSNGSQFFITVVPTDWLNGKHVVFGRVLRGMELVDSVSDAATSQADAPLEPVLISGCRAWKDAAPSKLT